MFNSQYWDTTTKECTQKISYDGQCTENDNSALIQCDVELTCTVGKCKRSIGSSCASNSECQTGACQLGQCKLIAMDSAILSTLDQNNLLSLINKTDKVFRLAYRASRDGWRSTDFHNHCNFIPNTLTVIKSTTGYIFGGFINGQWNSYSQLYNSDPYSFLYTLTNPSNTPAVMKMKNSDGAYAFYAYDSYGKKLCFNLCCAKLFCYKKTSLNHFGIYSSS